MITYEYNVFGIDGHRMSWSVEGRVNAEPGHFIDAMQRAMREALESVVGGPHQCDGPHRVIGFHIEEVI